MSKQERPGHLIKRSHLPIAMTRLFPARRCWQSRARWPPPLPLDFILYWSAKVAEQLCNFLRSYINPVLLQTLVFYIPSSEGNDPVFKIDRRAKIYVRLHLLSKQCYFFPMHGVDMVMPISEATGQVGHMHSILPIFWDSQVIIVFPSMLQNMPILEAMAEST